MHADTMDPQISSPNTPQPHGLLVRAGIWAAVAAALAGVLYLYSRPTFMAMLGDMIWACFGGAS